MWLSINIYFLKSLKPVLAFILKYALSAKNYTASNLHPPLLSWCLLSLFSFFLFFSFILFFLSFLLVNLNTSLVFSFVILQFSSNEAVACTTSKPESGCQLQYADRRIIINFITSSFSKEEELRCVSLVKSHDSTNVKIWQPFLMCWGFAFQLLKNACF